MDGLQARSQTPVPGFVTAGLAGMAASVPMAFVMILLHRFLPEQEKYPLPPNLITNQVAERVGAEELVDTRTKEMFTTWFSHIGYGAAVGTLFPVLMGSIPLPGWLRGGLFGLIVWSASYQGWIPAVDLLPPATQQPARRNALMIAAHLVYGGLIGLFVGEREE